MSATTHGPDPEHEGRLGWKILKFLTGGAALASILELILRLLDRAR